MQPIACAVVGYGSTYNFGRAHGLWINDAPGLELAAICTRSEVNQATARKHFPGVKIVGSVDELARDRDIGLCAITTPQYTHCDIALQLLSSGHHVVVDKPFAMTAAQADAMLHAADDNQKLIVPFHNRRYDGNYQTIVDIVQSGKIGQVFSVEVNFAGFYCRGSSWHGQKQYGGNALHEWGAHAIYWVLNLMAPRRVVNVTGIFHKLVWTQIDLEDHARAILRFDDGATADITHSFIDAAADKPLWRILGTKGAIVDSGRNAIEGYGFGDWELEDPPLSTGQLLWYRRTPENKTVCEAVPYQQSAWKQFYRDVSACLHEGAPMPFPREEGRRVAAILETAEKSAALGQALPVPFEM